MNVLHRTRRHFFCDCGVGLGGMALASLLTDERVFAADAARGQHRPARARSVIYLFMAGAPSQLELFDYKPALQQRNNQPIPDSFLEGKRFAFMDTFTREKPKLLGTRRAFRQHGQSAAWLSECLPQLASVADDLAIVKSMTTDVFNHAPAKLFANTGTTIYGRPSMGSWVTYGLGSESKELPGFVVLQSGPRGPRGGAQNYGSGFLPTNFQGVPLRSSGEPILNLSNPAGVTDERQRRVVEAVRNLNLRRLAEMGDPEIQTRIAQYEMAYRMQTSAPELMDLSQESPATLKLYGMDSSGNASSFARNCLLARRLVERGVRFVQLFHADWDHHGGPGADLGKSLDQVTREVDQPCAALIKDLKTRGLLESTLVIWGGEFGRTPMGENRETTGRNHHIDAYTVWLAGGGVRGGQTLGETDEFGFRTVEDKVHVHDLHATVLRLLGIDHERLTFKFQGRNFRLTDVAGEVVKKLLA